MINNMTKQVATTIIAMTTTYNNNNNKIKHANTGNSDNGKNCDNNIK